MNKEKKFIVGISCIGSGVGQSVINSCRLSRYPIKTIGLGTNPMAYGLYECDEYAYTASYYDNDYIENMLQVCLDRKIDLLVPGHDDEAHTLSKHLSTFEEAGIKVIVSGSELLDLCREKEQMSRALNPIVNIFVRSFTKDEFLSEWQKQEVELPVIAKPRDGYASKGIQIVLCEDDFSKITDGHIIQELALPEDGDPNRDFCLRQISNGQNPQVAEVSIQYVLDRSGRVMGKMASYNKLNNGVPIEILPFENEKMWADVDELIPPLVDLGARGPLNLQGRITNQGLKLFEINARFTGITGLRALLGFNEVEACIRHWLIDDQAVTLKINQNRVGIRQTADKVVNLDRNPEVEKNVRSLNRRVLKKEKTILVTGATGAIGRRLVGELSKDSTFEVLTLDRDKIKAIQMIKNDAVASYNYSDLESGAFSLGNVDCLIHLASARPHSGELAIAQSMSDSFALLTRAASLGVSEIINISSQSVYGNVNPPPWSEDSQTAPLGSYACQKYAVEQHLNSLKQLYPLLFASSIRLATVAASDASSSEVEVVGRMVQLAMRGEALKVFGGAQLMDRIDVRDAVSGIVRILSVESQLWRAVYNLGAGRQYTILEIAEKIVSAANAEAGNQEARVELIQSEKEYPSFGLNIAVFQRDFSWEPQFTLDDSIEYLIKG